MSIDLSDINSESDLDRATAAVSERLSNTRQQLRANSQELPASIKRAALQKSLPWLVGAAGVVVGSLLVRKLVKRHHRASATVFQPKPQQKSTALSNLSRLAATTPAKSIALTLFPIALRLFQSWAANRRQASISGERNKRK